MRSGGPSCLFPLELHFLFLCLQLPAGFLPCAETPLLPFPSCTGRIFTPCIFSPPRLMLGMDTLSTESHLLQPLLLNAGRKKQPKKTSYCPLANLHYFNLKANPDPFPLQLKVQNFWGERQKTRQDSFAVCILSCVLEYV